MKKLIAIAVVLALVAGVAFAEVNVSADVFAKITPLQGTTEDENDKVWASGEIKRGRVEISGQDENGVFGGYLRIDHSAWWAGVDAEAASITGNVWWKPIDQVKLLIGGNGKDGFFGADGVTRWGFYQVAADGVGVLTENWKFGNAFYGGFDPLYSAVLTVTPIEALELNFGFPLFDNGEAYKVYSKFNAQVAVNIAGAGRLAITYAGNEMDKDALDDGTNPLPKLYAYFGLNAIENLGIDIGVSYQIGDTYENSGMKATRFNPLAFGVGANFNAGAFGIKARVQATINGTTKYEMGGQSREWSDGYGIVVDILPSYAISDKISILLSAGLDINGGEEKYDFATDTKTAAGDAVVGWHVEPVITVKSSWWAPNFYAGIRIDSPGTKNTNKNTDATFINWSVPIGVAVSF